MSTSNDFPRNVFDVKPDTPTTILLCAFEGWNDAGAAASEAISYLERVYDTQEIDSFESEDYYDFTQMRPMLVSQDDGSGEITWPHIKVTEHRLAESNLRLLLLSGPEPNFRWKSFMKSLFAFAAEQKVEKLVLLGSLLAEVPHTRPFPIGCYSYTDWIVSKEGVDPQTYTGPTGIVGTLAYDAKSYGLADLSLWVSIPHYAGHPPHPKASYGLLKALETLLDISIPLQAIEDETHAWERGAAELMEEEPDLAEYVSQLEAQADNDPLSSISGDDLAAELEQFLKRRDQ